MRSIEWRSASPAEAARERRAAICRLADAVRGERELARRFAADVRPTIDWEAIDRVICERDDAEAALAEWAS